MSGPHRSTSNSPNSGIQHGDQAGTPITWDRRDHVEMKRLRPAFKEHIPTVVFQLSRPTRLYIAQGILPKNHVFLGIGRFCSVGMNISTPSGKRLLPHNSPHWVETPKRGSLAISLFSGYPPSSRTALSPHPHPDPRKAPVGIGKVATGDELGHSGHFGLRGTSLAIRMAQLRRPTDCRPNAPKKSLWTQAHLTSNSPLDNSGRQSASEGTIAFFNLNGFFVFCERTSEALEPRAAALRQLHGASAGSAIGPIVDFQAALLRPKTRQIAKGTVFCCTRPNATWKAGVIGASPTDWGSLIICSDLPDADQVAYLGVGPIIYKGVPSET
ncbi:hypothetical protein C8F04DRAFT_1183301 [Mycena alexandri]|uniref:Uncharacterized protein n=1 Tax=Mycena alexandri TaxID=1745969 RepID=A0AAD6X0N2_9AGAR|nr:hypothetical protein C8F04DRAFT_1183301 [Mycena alexandri]